MPRYLAVAVILTIAGVAVIAKATYTMSADKWYWDGVAENQISTADTLKKPNRGNILSCDGQLLAGSIPEYTLFVDLYPTFVRGVDSDTAWSNKLSALWRDSIGYLCQGLHEIFPQKDSAAFRADLLAGFNATRGRRHWPVWRGIVDYSTKAKVEKLPIMNLPAARGGLIAESHESRRHPFGSLAERTIGSCDTARYGIDLMCDSLLKGQYGIVHKQKVRNRMVSVITTPPVDGYDIISTIDVGMQDLAEQALLKELRLRNHLMGVAILMEVQTGDVKAIVNMERTSDGQYRERLNNALGYRCEPGSVFKTASMLVALDDAVVDTTFMINTGNGAMPMHGAVMKDHNHHKGGYGPISMARAMEVSSNIGISYIIDRCYGSNPQKYVDGLNRVGIGMDLGIGLNEYRKPRIRNPLNDNGRRAADWYATTLPWMSIGYETQIAPINTLAFYNAIANNGRMMQPRFVKQAVKDGEVIQEFEPVVLKEQIARPEAIQTMQTILRHVVSQGLGSRAGSRDFPVAGKTGTAQVSDGEYSYHSGVRCHWLSFCGYFPADNPKYSCIVCVKTTSKPASGGLVSGSVFHDIAEGVMSNNVRMVAARARQADAIMVPDVKNGDVMAADYVLSSLGVNTNDDWLEHINAQNVWGTATTTAEGVTLSQTAFGQGTMPTVEGMGARDATFLLEQLGLRVHIRGTGRVRSQSIPHGLPIEEGMRCELTLAN